MKNLCFLLLFVSSFLQAQESVCYGIEESINTKVQTCTFASAAFNDRYRPQQNYIDLIATAPVKQIAINMHVFWNSLADKQNFDDTPQDRAILTNAVYGVEGLNERYRNIAAPFRPYPCVCGDDCHITDSKIEFVLQDIYFHEDPVNHHAKSFNFPQYHVNIEHEINIYFTGNLPTGGGVGGAAELGGVVDQSGLNFSDDDELGLYLVNCFQPNTDPNTLSVIIGRQLAHELGHNLGLLHTYQATCCPEICNTQSLEYLDDVFGAGTTECPQNCHHPHIWNCGTPNNDFTDPQNCTNNMMSDANSSRYLSPEQIARVHRNTYLFSVKDYIFNCPKSAVPWEITENETWDFPIRMYEDIVVKSGATLTLQCEVRMPAEARIIVERGARLVVDGATITSACAGQRWQGIEVWGNPAVAHTAAMLNAANALAADGPGVVQFSNDALIENAICAVSTTRRNYASPQEYYGGIVQAQECTFLNNRKSVEMLRYTLANVSAFTDCIFECTDSQTHTGVSLWAVSNIPFKGCTFTNLQQYGITGLDASFMVQDACNFSGQSYGIYTRSSLLVPTNQVRVGILDATDEQRNIFHNNTFDICSFGSANLFAYNNDFIEQTEPTGTVTLGNLANIYARGGKKLSGNAFEAKGNLLMSGSVGIMLSGLGMYENLIECNDFENTFIGISAEGNNSGLNIAENDFTCSEADVYVLGAGMANGSIADQGTADEPQVNLFSAAHHHHFIADAAETEEFIYYYPENPSDARLVPHCDYDDTDGYCLFHNHYYANIAAPLEGYAGCLEVEDSPITPDPCVPLTRDCLEGERDIIRNLKQEIDNDSKEVLLSKIATTPNQYSTYQSLKTASPYLSDSVLAATAEQTAMAQWKRNDILLSNAPLSDSLMNIAYNHVPAGVYALLYSIKTEQVLSARDYLSSDIKRHSSRKELILQRLLQKFMTENDSEQIQEVLEEEGTTAAVQTLLCIKIAQNDVAAAQSLLNALPTDTEEEADFKTLQSINLQYYSATTEYTPTTAQLNTLLSIAEKPHAAAAQAAALWSHFTGEAIVPDIPDLVFPAAKQQGAARYPQAHKINTDAARLQCSPNPAGGNTLHICTPYTSDAVRNVVELYDAQGRLMTTFVLSADNSCADFSIAALPSGIYWAAWKQDGHLTQSTQWIKL